MTATSSTTPKCTMGDAFIKLDCAVTDLDEARFALASLVEEENPEISPHVIRCIMSALDVAASDLKAGLEVVNFEHEAFKAWETKNASPTGEARP